jgi:hypothetical protein
VGHGQRPSNSRREQEELLREGRDPPTNTLANANEFLLGELLRIPLPRTGAAFKASGERREALVGAIALALDFQTWRTLVRQQELNQDRAVGLMVGMVRCLMRA